ncbi:MAG: hypothetical protein MI741_06890 [Rhodospirillales bacterium]|nr:hypothetical protein [Rhodospirillales bacterium]
MRQLASTGAFDVRNGFYTRLLPDTGVVMSRARLAWSSASSTGKETGVSDKVETQGKNQ